MHAWRDFLPDLKGALTGFYQENLAATVEAKTTEFKSLIEKNLALNLRTQKALMAVALGIFFLLAIALF
jgi:hypothetical protein